MKIIDRYILREFFRIFFMSMIVMIAFYEMVTFIDMAGYFFKFKATFDMIIRYLAFKVPMGLFHVTPICVLLASVLTIGSLSRNSELVAMKSTGMSMLRVSMPIIVAGAIISGISFANSEYIFPTSARETKRIYYDEIKKQSRNSLFSGDRFWYKADDGAIWNIGHIDQVSATLRDLSVYRFNKANSKIIKRASASEGKMLDGKWKFKNYVELTFNESGGFDQQRWDERTFPADMVPTEDLTQVKLDPEEMNLQQMQGYIKDIKTKGYDATKYVVDVHSKIGFPLISFVMPFLAIPLGARSSRSGGALIGIGVAVVIGVIFWFSFSMGLSFSRAERLPVMLGAYGAHGIFLMVGLYMLLTDRQ